MNLRTLSVEASWEVVAVEEGEPATVTVSVEAGDESWLMSIETDLSGEKRERFREEYGL